ncbi:hypothetical protein PQR15_03090 [Streptomyces lydicus]|nr:hypothetical protein [Streptomyces lydicus]
MPIDPAYPGERRHAMVRDAGARVLVTTAVAGSGRRACASSPSAGPAQRWTGARTRPSRSPPTHRPT